MKNTQPRKINIINNNAFGKLMKSLGKLNLNSWYPVDLTADNKITILGKQWEVEFVDESDGNWFKIVDITENVIKMKKIKDFTMMKQ